MKSARLGDVLVINRSRITPDPTTEYGHIGVRSFGKGLIEYGPTLGADLSKVTYHRFPANSLLLSNIKAWEGAITRIGEEHDKFIASQRFLPYIPRSVNDVDVNYVFHYLLSDSGLHAMGKASPGSADRNRTLGRTAFEAINLPLPEITEQRAIAARLDSISDIASHSLATGLHTDTASTSITHGLFDTDSRTVQIGQLLTQTTRFEAVEPDRQYTAGGVKWYAEGVFARDAKPSREIKATRLNRLVAGEFIYNRLFAWKGSFALTPDHDLHVSNEFPTFAIDRSQVLPEYLLGCFSLPRVWNEVLRLSTGATPTSRNRLKENQLLGLEMPLPPLATQAAVVEKIRLAMRVRDLTFQKQLVASALPQAARNAEFARLMI